MKDIAILIQKLGLSFFPANLCHIIESSAELQPYIRKVRSQKEKRYISPITRLKDIQSVSLYFLFMPDRYKAVFSRYKAYGYHYRLQRNWLEEWLGRYDLTWFPFLAITFQLNVYHQMIQVLVIYVS